MSSQRYEWIDRLKGVEREHRVAASAVERLERSIFDGVAEAPPGTSPRDLVAARLGLEATYLVRLWAEFETALLSYLRFLRGEPDTRLRASDLINTLAAVRHGRAIPDSIRDAVHEVREYRNALVHERADPAAPVGLVDARRRLNTFLGKLPERWG